MRRFDTRAAAILAASAATGRTLAASAARRVASVAALTLRLRRQQRRARKEAGVQAMLGGLQWRQRVLRPMPLRVASVGLPQQSQLAVRTQLITLPARAGWTALAAWPPRLCCPPHGAACIPGNGTTTLIRLLPGCIGYARRGAPTRGARVRLMA